MLADSFRRTGLPRRPRLLPQGAASDWPVSSSLGGNDWLLHVRRWTERALWLAGLLLLAAWVRTYDEARTFRAIETRKFESLKENVAVAPPASNGSARAVWMPEHLESGVFGRIEIPRLGISALITEGTEPANLEKAVGHFVATALPGEDGNCALAGHRDGDLRGLGKVRTKDLIRIDTLQDTYTYEVEWGSVVEPDQVDVLDSTPKPSLTLVTCYPFHAVGPAPERFVVRARLVDSTE